MKVTLVYGGTSTEKETSKLNAKNIAPVLESMGHKTAMVPYTKDIIAKIKETNPDVVFVCVQGKGHGDGTIQAMLEHEGIPYTGSDMRAASLINDKILCKLLFEKCGIPTPKWELISYSEFEDGSYVKKINAVGYPLLCKSPTQGLGIGIEYIGKESDNILVKKVFDYDPVVALEQYVQGDFYTVAVIEKDCKVQALPVLKGIMIHGLDGVQGTVLPQEKICDCDPYYIVKPDTTDEVLKKMQEIAVEVFRVCGARDMARIDIMLPKGSEEPLVLEINAVPGLKQSSFYPNAAFLAGMTYEELIETLLQSAASRIKK